jgi:hypothetical protein
MSIHSKPSNADGHSEGQTRTARETIPSKKGDQLLPMRLRAGQIGGRRQNPWGEWWRTMFGPAGYAEKRLPFPRVVSLVVVILFRTLPERGRFELALRSLHVLTISNRT